MSEAPEQINMKDLADLVEEGLAGIGILDEAGEILSYTFEEGGMEAVKKAQTYYNNGIAFINENQNSHVNREPIAFITDEEISDWFEDE